MNLVIASLLIVISIVLLGVMAVLMKKYFAFRRNDVNVPAFVNFYNLIIDVGFFAMFVKEYYFGEGFPFLHVWIAQIAGFLWSIATFLIVYVNLRGNAGTSEALIQTSVIYQTIIDSIFFWMIPNIMQIVGLVLGLIATLVIMIGHTQTN